MPPRKRKSTSQNQTTGVVHPEHGNERKRVTRVQQEKNICKNRLETLDQEESFSTEDRFTQAERGCLLDAYDKLGFQVFQDVHLLKQYLPGRTERDLKGLLDRLRIGLQHESSSDNDDKIDNLDGWLRLSQSLMGNFARDKRVNLDDALADALVMIADEQKLNNTQQTEIDQDVSNEPNYPELLRSFSQLLMGKFPNNMTPANARISCKLFDHITSLVDSMNLERLGSLLESGSWLQSSTGERRRRLEMALVGLDELDSNLKKCPTTRDLKSENIEALCLELPKIKRITELLNPLNINDSLLDCLMDL
jgi:hypothetical protein